MSDTREQRLFKALVELVMAVGSHPDAMRDGAPLNAAYLRAAKVVQEPGVIGRAAPPPTLALS